MTRQRLTACSVCGTRRTQLTFGREYTAAVEAKQVAQQEAERAKFIVRPRRRTAALCSRASRWCERACVGVQTLNLARPARRRRRAQVEKAEQDKKSAIIRAEGEAKSAQLLGEAIQNNPAFLTLRKIEAEREIASTIEN